MPLELHELQLLEEQLLQADFRRDREAVSRVLAEEFREFGSSGQVYDKARILDLLQDEPPFTAQLSNFQATLLADDVAQVTYQTSRDGAPNIALRSSLWIRREGRWQMLFHQGTLVRR